MDRFLKLLGVKKPDLNEAMPENDDIDSKGMTQYFNIPIGGIRLPGENSSVMSGVFISQFITNKKDTCHAIAL